MFSKSSLRLIVGGGTDLIRAGIRRMLADNPEILIVDECADANAAVIAIRELRPDVVLTDFYLGSGSAVDVLQACRSVQPRPVAIVHTQFGNAGIRAISYAAGADVFYGNDGDLAPLLKMLRKLAGAMVDVRLEQLIA